MAQWLKQSTATTVKMGPFCDSGDGVTAKTALAIAQADIRLTANGGAFAQTHNAAGATHDENGYYGVPLDTTDTATLGRLRVAVSKATALPVWQDFVVVAANVFDSLIGGGSVLDANAKNIGGVAQTGLDLAANYTAARATKLDNLDATISSRSTYAGGAVASVTGNVGGDIVGDLRGNVQGQVGGVAGDVVGDVEGRVWGSVGSVSGVVDILQSAADKVWLSLVRTLTQVVTGGVVNPQVVPGGAISLYRGTTLSPNLTVNDFTGWTKLIMTVKRNRNDPDSAALMQLVVSNPAAGSDGLLTLNGAPYTGAATDGALIVAGTTGVTPVVKPLATALLPLGMGFDYDVKAFLAGGVEVEVADGAGLFSVVAAATGGI